MLLSPDLQISSKKGIEALVQEGAWPANSTDEERRKS